MSAQRERREKEHERERESRGGCQKQGKLKDNFGLPSLPICAASSLCNPQQFHFAFFPSPSAPFLFAFLSPTRDICINYHLFNKKKGDRIQRERDTLKWKWHQRLSLSFLPLSLSLSAGKLVIKVKCIK